MLNPCPSCGYEEANIEAVVGHIGPYEVAVFTPKFASGVHTNGSCQTCGTFPPGGPGEPTNHHHHIYTNPNPIPVAVVLNG